MKRKLFSVLSGLFAALLITSTVFAGHIRFSQLTFSTGTDTTGGSSSLAAMTASDTSSDATSYPTLIAQGTMTGLGEQDVRVVLVASGLPEVTCANQGGNQAPGQNPPRISVSGEQLLFGFDLTQKNGMSLFDVKTGAPPILDAVEYGCPNANWSAHIDSIDWQEATISVVDLYNNANVLFTQNYTCTTSANRVTCTPVK